MDVVISSDGVAFLQTPDGRLLEVGTVAQAEPSTAEQLRAKAHGALNPADFSGQDPSDVLAGEATSQRPAVDDNTGKDWGVVMANAGKSHMSAMHGGFGKKDQADARQTEGQVLVGAMDKAAPEAPKSLSDRIGDIASRAVSSFSGPAKPADWPPMPKQPEKKPGDKEA